MTPGAPQMILVTPVFNESEVIAPFLARVRSLGAQVPLAGLVIVDDGSGDDTCRRLVEVCGGWTPGPRVRLIRLTRNFGHQNAVLAGLSVAYEWAARAGVELIGLMDGDLQDRPEHLADLLRAAADADVAYAVRATRGEGLVFRILAGLFHHLLASISQFPIPRDAGTFCVMRAHVARLILENADRSPYFPGLRAWVGYRQVGVSLDRDARFAGSSRVGVTGLARLALGAFLGYSDLPLRLLAYLALFTIGVSTVASITIIALKLAGLVQVQGTALIITAIFFSLGVQSIYLLLIAYALSRATSESSNKRPFLIMSDEELA